MESFPLSRAASYTRVLTTSKGYMTRISDTPATAPEKHVSMHGIPVQLVVIRTCCELVDKGQRLLGRHVDSGGGLCEDTGGDSMR